MASLPQSPDRHHVARQFARQIQDQESRRATNNYRQQLHFSSQCLDTCYTTVLGVPFPESIEPSVDIERIRLPASEIENRASELCQLAK